MSNVGVDHGTGRQHADEPDHASPRRPAWATERVEIAPYDPTWPRRAARHVARLHHLLDRWLVRPVEHVGSTAVPGLAAKPIVDLQAAVADLADAGIVQTLHADGWVPVPPELDRRPWRRLHVLPQGDRRAAHLHVMAGDSPRWHAQLAFRDALRADPGLVVDYARLKADLAGRHPDDREAYTEGKASFVRGVLDAAAGDARRRQPAAPPSARRARPPTRA